MALAQQPRLLLLDEPTQGLSVEETAQAVETLAGLLSDGAMTVLLVEHDMEVVFRLARMITVLHRGAVIADGAPDEVKADHEVQRPILGSRLMLTDRRSQHALRREPRAAGRRSGGAGRDDLFGTWAQWRRQDDDVAHGDGTGATELAAACGWTAPTSPAGRRIAWRVPASRMCRRAG